VMMRALYGTLGPIKIERRRLRPTEACTLTWSTRLVLSS
jgi:hypothetical protein